MLFFYLFLIIFNRDVRYLDIFVHKFKGKERKEIFFQPSNANRILNEFFNFKFAIERDQKCLAKFRKNLRTFGW